jgi:hypothetical protein
VLARRAPPPPPPPRRRRAAPYSAVAINRSRGGGARGGGARGTARAATAAAAAAAAGAGAACADAAGISHTRCRETVTTPMMHFAATLLLVTTAVIHSSPGSVSTTINSLPLYKQAQAPIEQRVHDLVSRMTIDEKVAQMLGDGGGARIYRGHRPVDKFKETGVGSAGNQVRKLEDLHAQNALQAAMINSSRLGIPIDFTAETLHSGGHAGCTVFPMPCLQGSSWNVTLVQKIAASNALQARASGTNHGLSPVINVATDPRFGRTQESFSEDPFIVGTMAVAAVLGNQGQDGAGGPNSYLGSPRTTMISQAKHFYAVRNACPSLRSRRRAAQLEPAAARCVEPLAWIIWYVVRSWRSGRRPNAARRALTL